MKKSILVFFSFFIFSALTFSENDIPQSFRGVKLGMNVEETKKALKDDIEFGYRGDRDVSLSPGTDQVLIETDGVFAAYSFLDRCYFQFTENKLSAITINMNREKMDHYSVFKKLCEKYGQPESVTPEKSTWQDDSVIFSLERPLALKYIDRKAFEKKQSSIEVKKTSQETAREEFLDSL